MKRIQITKVLISKLSDTAEVDNSSFAEELNSFLEKHGYEPHYLETSSVDIAKFSIQQCSNCESYMVNRDCNPNRFDPDEDDKLSFILEGATLDGENLCEFCLPSNHRWGIDVEESDDEY